MLIVTAAGLAALALAAVAAVAVQQVLGQATVASAQAASLEKLAFAAGEVASFAPGTQTAVSFGLLAQNTSFSYAGGSLRLRYWHEGKTRALERAVAGKVEISNTNFSKGNFVATVANRGGTAVISIAHAG